MTKANDRNSGKSASGKYPAPKDRQTSGNRENNARKATNEELGKLSAARSGTTPLASDTSTSNDQPGPGGVEGTGGSN
ncbi:MAG TPA: hypothetical protein VFC35_09465 [Gemmatimonadaceae bacterium]|nr:hypothetical protein [Gemmatimonadaceae bacterium]